MFRNICLILAALFSLIAAPTTLISQSAPTAASSPASTPAMTQLTALRDDFIAQIKTEGFQPSLPAPTIVFDNPPAFGRYDDEKNILHIAEWKSLPPDQQGRFSRLAAVMGGEKTGEQMFEESIYHWVFVHELSHWWQACEHKSAENRYSIEYGANRIAAAYWRQKDPALMKRTEQRMFMVRDALPDPVPDGQAKEKYFNENFAKLATMPGYIWYQYSMVLDVQAEKPLPTFKQALQHP